MTQFIPFIRGPLHNRKILMTGQPSSWPDKLVIVDDAHPQLASNYILDRENICYNFSHFGDESRPDTMVVNIPVAEPQPPQPQRIMMRFVGGRLDGQLVDVQGQTDQLPNVMHMIVDPDGDTSAYYILDRNQNCYRFSHYGQPPTDDAARLIKQIPPLPDDF